MHGYSALQYINTVLTLDLTLDTKPDVGEEI